MLALLGATHCANIFGSEHGGGNSDDTHDGERYYGLK
jgi:hypothetical protein